MLNDMEKTGQQMTRQATQKLNELKDVVVNERPLDMDHEGISNLTNRQKEALSEILTKQKDNQPLLLD